MRKTTSSASSSQPSFLDRPLSRKEKSTLRRRALQQVLGEGKSVGRVANELGLSSRTIYRWLREYRLDEEDSLEPKPRKPRSDRRLNQEQSKLLLETVDTTLPSDHGWEGVLWTQALISQLVEKLFHVKLSPRSCGKLMKRLGFTPQKPIRKSYRQDPVLVEEWKTSTFPELAQQTEQEGISLHWLDESSLQSDANCGRTWAPSGYTPTVPAVGSPHRLSVIGSVGWDGSMNFLSFDGSINTSCVQAYLQVLMNKEAGKVVVILDNASYHRSAALREFVQTEFQGRLRLVFQPPYSPELNPAELIWAYLKGHHLNKLFCRTKADFQQTVESLLKTLGKRPDLGRSFFGKRELDYIGKAMPPQKEKQAA